MLCPPKGCTFLVLDRPDAATRSHVEKLARDGAEVDVLLGALAVSSLSDRVVEEQPLR